VRSLGTATDGVVTIHSPTPEDVPVLLAGRDELFHRFLGEGSPDPQPTACIAVGGDTVGWVDFDTDRTWLQPGEVNLGYNVFAPHRGRGYATRAVKLLLHRLALSTNHRTATLLIRPDNHPSLALADRAGFERVHDLDGNAYWKRPIPPLSYTDGVVMIRRPQPGDLEMDLAAKDEEQIRWLWLPGQREAWNSMTAAQQRNHARAGLQERIAAFGAGPKWTFSVDTDTTPYVAYVDCDLANNHVPTGEANISYAAHPDHRRNGHVRRAVSLTLQFLRDHTGAREAHIITDADNHASRRVAESAGATVTETWTNEHGRTMVRHVATI